MSSFNEGGIPIEASKDNLVKKWVYIVEVCNFTFHFASLDQIEECLEYFKQKTHPSTKSNYPLYEHYWHPWYCKLPKGIMKENNRQKVIKILNQLLKKWKDT